MLMIVAELNWIAKDEAPKDASDSHLMTRFWSRSTAMMEGSVGS